ncbi:MAG: MFS transporter [Chlorobi bacterium]|nr:MFS transporter [Chlorobiota bacterium]MCI0716845.1 MFS transporter [Chlorobiota bacterium]
MQESRSKNIRAIVIVAALGYFVDIYDLILFGIVRVASLKGLGITDDVQLRDVGVLLLNMQMAGMLLGGILWGILGDKRGRISVLFGSIIMYSAANILNGMVQDIPQYSALRFIAGIGLAGELGAGITLVSEVMSKESRGYGTTIVATIGILGAVAAALVADFFQWRTAYYVGGAMGLVLLFLRIGMYESGMFKTMIDENIGRGQFQHLFTNWSRFVKYLRCILIGVPLWFVVGILITFSDAFAKKLGVEGIAPAKSIMFCYIGLAIGDFSSGYLSQVFKSRKKIILWFIFLTNVLIVIYLFFNQFGSFYFYTLCLLLGLTCGYWAVFVTNASEQFGTNLRATVTTTVPNFVRGSVVPVSLLFQFLSPMVNIIYSAAIVASITLVLAYISVLKLEETYGKDLDYIEML